MKKQFEKHTYFDADIYEIQDLMTEVYEKAIEIYDHSNDRYYKIVVQSKEYGKPVDEALSIHSEVKEIMDDICFKGVIEPGIYLISSSW